MLTVSQLLCAEHLRHRVHALPARHRGPAVGARPALGREDPGVPGPGGVVAGGGCEHPGGQRRGQEPGWAGCVSHVCLLSWPRLLVLYQLGYCVWDGRLWRWSDIRGPMLTCILQYPSVFLRDRVLPPCHLVRDCLTEAHSRNPHPKQDVADLTSFLLVNPR